MKVGSLSSIIIMYVTIGYKEIIEVTAQKEEQKSGPLFSSQLFTH